MDAGHSGVASPSFHRTSVKVSTINNSLTHSPSRPPSSPYGSNAKAFAPADSLFIKRTFSAMAASHRDDSPSSLLFPAPDDHYSNEHSARRRRVQAGPVQPPRYAGDGLDFRRPVMAEVSLDSPRGERRNGNGATDDFTVIDLTEEDGMDMETNPAVIDGEQELANVASEAHTFGGTIGDAIEVDDEDEDADEDETSRDLPGANFLALPGPHRTHPQFSILRRPTREEDGEPDTRFQSQRHRQRRSARSHASRLNLHRSRTATPSSNDQSATIDLTEDDGDDVIITETRTREGTGVNLEPPGVAHGQGPRTISYENLGNIAGMLRDQGGRLMQRLNHIAGLADFGPPPLPVQPPFFDDHPFVPHFGPPRNLHRGVGERPHMPPQPGYMQNFIGNLMNYEVPAFNYDNPEANRPEAHEYSPPPQPEFGFTRSPEEDEIVVCPNCGDELAMGDTELKQQIWVVKGCGHAYCGECAVHRSRSTGRKVKGKDKEKEKVLDPTLPPPFKTCVVPNCDKSTKGKAMIHVYLGS